MVIETIGRELWGTLSPKRQLEQRWTKKLTRRSAWKIEGKAGKCGVW